MHMLDLLNYRRLLLRPQSHFNTTYLAQVSRPTPATAAAVATLLTYGAQTFFVNYALKTHRAPQSLWPTSSQALTVEVRIHEYE